MTPNSKYLGFYTTQPVWIGEKLPVNMPMIDGRPRGDVMGEVVVGRNTPGYELHMCRDGLCLLRVESLENDMSKIRSKMDSSIFNEGTNLLSIYLSHCNALRLLIETGLFKATNLSYFRTAPIRKGEAQSIEYKDGKCIGATAPEGKGAELFDQRRPIGNNWLRTEDRYIMNKEVVTKAFEIYLTICPNREAIRMLSETCSCLGELNFLNWEGCLIHSWFIIEYFLKSKWVDYIINAKESDLIELTKENREYLIGRDFTVAVISNAMALAGLISKEEFERIDRLRKRRNEIIHNQNLVRKLQSKLRDIQTVPQETFASVSDCITSIEQVETMINSSYDLELVLPKGVVWSYP
jgi:hypothetical protein